MTSRAGLKMSCSSAVLVLLSTVALMLVLNAAGAEGKRGCVNFGHSCYGGMGKRASDLIDTNEEVLQNVEDVEENPAFVFTGPRSSYKPKPDRLTQQQYDNISRIVRQWIANYRRMQEAPNENM